MQSNRLVPLAVLALLSWGCTMNDGGGGAERTAISEGEQALAMCQQAGAKPTVKGSGSNVVDNKRVRNDATSLCLAERTSLDTVTSSSCSNINPFVRWSFEEVSAELFTIQPRTDEQQCLTLLVPEAGDVPVLGPCDDDGLEAAGQLFRINCSGDGQFTIADPSGAVYLTALQPNGVVALPLGDPNLPSPSLQYWRLY